MSGRTQQTMTAAEFRKMKLKAKGRGTGRGKGGPNDNERDYARLHLASYKRISYEGRTFQLAERCQYTPDWECEGFDGSIEYHEIKHDQSMGKNRQRDSGVRFKCASAMNPEFVFVWAKWNSKKKCYKREFWKGGRKIQ